MNCRKAKTYLYSEGARALDIPQRAALEDHLAGCAGCRRIHDTLVGVVASWRVDVARTPLPDPEVEWQAVRRSIRGGAGARLPSTAHTPWRRFAWVALPVGAAAAAAVALFVSPGASPALQPEPVVRHIAQANSVEAPGDNASTMVFVDDKSGWLIVWASDAAPKRG